tara:strand:- start:41 stop:1318 length:1278 start_codon:yes stop_codon:yes gene_type:complete
MSKKKIIIFCIFIILFFSLKEIVKQDEIRAKKYINRYLWPYTPVKIQYFLKILYDDAFIKQLQNDYNVKFLPKTQLLNVNFTKAKLDFLTERKDGIYNKNTVRKSFQIELIEDNKAWIIDNAGIISQINLKKILSNEKEKVQHKIITSNIKPHQILDSFVHDNKIYLSFVSLKDKCFKFNIYMAPIVKKDLIFESFFTPEECNKTIIQGGRMQHYIHKNQKGLLFTVGDSSTPDFNNNNSQNVSSIFGKILFKGFIDNKDYSIFSIGHRNPQGLYVDDNLILSTEHGPKSGDEINNIIFGQNYGWPIASYGESYFDEGKLRYKKDHASYSFKEPVFSFLPAIGISEIIKIPDNFTPFWKNNFILSSLNASSLYRIKFNKNLDRIILSEKIYIGERIRDLKYSKKFKTIFLALESEGNLGILNLKD